MKPLSKPTLLIAVFVMSLFGIALGLWLSGEYDNVSSMPIVVSGVISICLLVVVMFFLKRSVR